MARALGQRNIRIWRPGSSYIMWELVSKLFTWTFLWQAQISPANSYNSGFEKCVDRRYGISVCFTRIDKILEPSVWVALVWRLFVVTREPASACLPHLLQTISLRARFWFFVLLLQCHGSRQLDRVRGTSGDWRDQDGRGQDPLFLWLSPRATWVFGNTAISVPPVPIFMQNLLNVPTVALIAMRLRIPHMFEYLHGCKVWQSKPRAPLTRTLLWPNSF